MEKRDYSNNGYLSIKAHNPYVPGIIGTDIKLTLKQRILILFCEGISVSIGNVFEKEGGDDGTQEATN